MKLLVFIFSLLTLHLLPQEAQDVRKDIVTISVQHYDYNGNTVTGTLECNKSIANDLKEIFAELYKAGYRIEKMRPVSNYDGDDDRSMEDNNTSCYNYRPMVGSKKGTLSKHATGMAIDINPLYNPYVKGNVVKPASGKPYAKKPQITADSFIVRLFKKHGFNWGGDWKTLKDYQHFEK